MSQEPVKLAFGYHHGLPPGAKAAWGARLIVTQDGSTDLLHDRQGAGGEETLIRKTMDWINGPNKPVDKAREAASNLLKTYTMRTNKEEEFTLYRDDRGTVVGNTNGSYGYLYIVAWLHESEERWPIEQKEE